MVLKIIIGLPVIIGGFLTYVALQPDEWSPWKEVDPQVQLVRSGPEEGVGAKASWESSGQMGTGSATVSESIPNQKVTVALEYTKPMSMTQTAEFNILPAATGTVVEWSVRGKNSFIGRIFCVFMNMDKMVGGNFEKGLVKLKANVEAGT